MLSRSLLLLSSGLILAVSGANLHESAAPSGWTQESFREEIRPGFSYNAKGGPHARGSFVIQTDARDGLDGFWRREFPVTGRSFYAFQALRKTTGAEFPQQCAVITVQWLGADGKRVVDDRKLVERYLVQYNSLTPLEYPVDGPTLASGWIPMTGTWQAPSTATKAIVELHGRWAPNTRFEYSEITFNETQAPAPRIVRLAAVHLRPVAGKSAEEKRTQFASLIEQAANRKADLIVLPETLTYYNAGNVTPADVAEPVPGPTTRYFAELARKHNVYIVAGLFEKDQYKVYNAAVLLTPDGEIGGKYRKVTLPDSEASVGVAPGHEYPIFKTRFGMLGMMVCYDGFFPEVARELAKRGAEVIAWPVWGCNPDLARARAAENHVYLVSSTYEDISSNWMRTAIWDHSGGMADAAKDFGTLAMAEVDLNATTRWRSLGDFRSKISHHVPMTPSGDTWVKP